MNTVEVEGTAMWQVNQLPGTVQETATLNAGFDTG